LLTYVIGDEITARMELWHRMNLFDVNVVFEHHVDPAITLTLGGVPEFVRYVPSQDRQDAGSSTGEVYRESEVLLRGEVELDHLPGDYAVSYVEFYTASGQEIRHDILADENIPSRIRITYRAFRIVPEPNSIDSAALELVDARTYEESSLKD
jgi:hypothetical protein